MEKKQKIAMKKGIVRGNCPGSIILGGNCPGAIVQGVVVRGGNCPGGNCPRTVLCIILIFDMFDLSFMVIIKNSYQCSFSRSMNMEG